MFDLFDLEEKNTLNQYDLRTMVILSYISFTIIQKNS